jgi:hypothetical protein
MAGDFDISDEDFNDAIEDHIAENVFDVEEEKKKCIVCKRKFYPSQFGSAQVSEMPEGWVCSEECFDNLE